MKGTLTKINLLSGADSAVNTGRTQTGRLVTGIPGNIIDDAELTDIEIDYMVVCYNGPFDYVKTSPIVNIMELTDTKIVFETQTSIYEFIVDNQEKDIALDE